MKIVADDKIPFLKGVLEPFAEVIYLPGGKIGRKDVADADALIVRTRTRCDSSLLSGTTVGFIATATIGFDHIDTDYCRDHNIVWTNAPGCNSSSVQQYIAAGLLKIARGRELALRDMVLGIIGVGNVGAKVELTGRALGMKILLNDPPRERAEGSLNYVTLDTILSKSDIITLHVPLTDSGEDKTRHLFNAELFNKMRDNTWIINSSRGEVVDTSALKNALKSGRLSGAIIDVWEHEPDIDTELLSAATIATPHIAGYSTDGKANGTSVAVNSLCRHFGLPLNDWFPSDVPEPDHPILIIDGRGMGVNDIVFEAVRHTYDIAADDNNLRIAPAAFEKLRGEYRVRREFSAYTVLLKGGPGDAERILNEMGFRVERG